MANHVSHACFDFIVKGARFTFPVPYLDADGDPTDPTTPDTEVSKDGAAFADMTEEVTTISGSNGMGYVTLTGDETNCTLLAVAAKVASGPKATLLRGSTRTFPSIRTGTAQAGAAGTITLDSSASAVDDYYVGCIVKTTGGTGGGGGSGSLGNQARMITDYVGSTKVATIEPNWETTPDSTTTFAVLLTDLAYNLGGSDLATINTKLDTIDDFLDTEIAAIKAKTDNLPADPADASDIAASFATINTTLQGLILTNGTIGSTGNDTTHLHLDGLTYGDDEINSYLLVIRDVSESEYHARWITDWVLATELATIATLPFTPEDATDTYWLLPIRADVTGGSGLDAAGVRAAIGLASANLDTQLSTLDDFLDTEVAAILAAVDTEVAAIKAKTDNLPADPADASDIAASFSTVNTKLNTIDDYIDTEIAAIKAKTDQLTFTTANRVDCQVFGMEAGVVTAAAIAAAAIDAATFAADVVTFFADAVWDAAIADHLDAGSTGVTLQAAGNAGDPWSTAIPGAYAAGTAGYIVGTNLDDTISSRASQTSVNTIDDFLDTEVAAIKTKTDNLPADPADASDVAASFSTVNTKLDTIDDFLDTEVAAIKAKTDQLTFTVANQVDANAISTPGSDLPGGRIVAVYKRELDTFEADLILTINGEPVSFDGTGVLTVRDADGVLVFAALNSDLITDAGDGLKHLHWEKLTPGFTADRLYSLRAVITDGVDNYTINDVFTVLG